MHAAGFLFGALAACSCSYLSRQSSRESSAIGKKRALSFLLLGLFLFAQAVNAWSWFSSTAAPLDSGFLSPPGSFLARALLPIPSPWRRVVEPSIWCLLVSLILVAQVARSGLARAFFMLAVDTVFVLLACEVLALGHEQQLTFELPGGAGRSLPLPLILSWSFLVILTLALLLELLSYRGAPEPRRGYPSSGFLRRRIGRDAAHLLTGLLIVFLSGRADGPAVRGGLLVGVHYYSWFPENWPAGLVGEHLRPQVLPQLGMYQSDGEGVFAQHLAWMKSAGVNLIVFDWWAKRTGARKRILENIEALGESDPYFSVQYEPHDIKERSDLSVGGEDDNVIILTPERQKRLVTHFRHLAKRHFKHPRYLRVRGRPVIFIYSTRHLVGDVVGAISAARDAVREEIGVNPYIVADEVYFNVLDYSSSRGVFMRALEDANWRRLSAFDAITCYNGFDASRPEHFGSQGVKQYLADMESLYNYYRHVASVLGVEFFPGVLPGYNDRGVRLVANHGVFPRAIRSTSGIESESFFVQSLKRLVAPALVSGAPGFIVTSWNEWNEGSQIEPSTLSAPSTEDSSGNFGYTLGELHEGYGEQYLQQLRQFVDNLPQ